MTSMMMLDITMVVSVNKSLPINVRPKPSLGTSSWSFLGTFGILDILVLALGKLYSFGLWAKFSSNTE